jgi:hypothetical protein
LTRSYKDNPEQTERNEVEANLDRTDHHRMERPNPDEYRDAHVKGELPPRFHTTVGPWRDYHEREDDDFRKGAQIF